MNRLNRLVLFFLVALPLAPFGFFLLVLSPRQGRDLAALYFTGIALFLVGAILLVVIGLWQRRNGWIKSGLALFVSLVVVFSCSGGEVRWIGAETIVVTVVVRDASTKQPIPNAAVRLFDEYEEMDSNASEGHTDEKGTCVLDHRFWTVGTVTPVRDTGGYYLWKDTLKVDAVDYHGISEKLDTFTGKSWPLYGPPIPVVEVNLKRKPD